MALDVAILPSSEVAARAVAVSAALPEEGAKGLRLDAEHLPHITLSQQFVRDEELPAVFERLNEVLAEQPPLRVRITGGGHSGHTLWMAVERTEELLGLHHRVMDALVGLERPDGGPHAFFEETGRVRDVLWVAGFRLKAGLAAYTPHLTLGHGTTVPSIEPIAFDATTIAACHLGRFCACRRVLRAWTLRSG